MVEICETHLYLSSFSEARLSGGYTVYKYQIKIALKRWRTVRTSIVLERLVIAVELVMQFG